MNKIGRVVTALLITFVVAALGWAVFVWKFVWNQ